MARRKGLLPVTKAVRYLRSTGWVADQAERKMGILSKDWCGFADVIADAPQGVLYLQVTSCANVSSRVAKVKLCEEAKMLASRSGRFVEVWGYESKTKTYEPKRVVRLTVEDFA